MERYMNNPWMITLAGLGTVFLTLIGLMGMLSLFRIIFGKRKEKGGPDSSPLPEIRGPSGGTKALATAVPASATVPADFPSNFQSLDGELVAVISAAVAAASGAPASSFRIASVSASSGSERGFNTPVWGRIERLGRN